jgi:hypothetical protein
MKSTRGRKKGEERRRMEKRKGERGKREREEETGERRGVKGEKERKGKRRGVKFKRKRKKSGKNLQRVKIRSRASFKRRLGARMWLDFEQDPKIGGVSDFSFVLHMYPFTSVDGSPLYHLSCIGRESQGMEADILLVKEAIQRLSRNSSRFCRREPDPEG